MGPARGRHQVRPAAAPARPGGRWEGGCGLWWGAPTCPVPKPRAAARDRPCGPASPSPGAPTPTGWPQTELFRLDDADSDEEGGDSGDEGGDSDSEEDEEERGGGKERGGGAKGRGQAPRQHREPRHILVSAATRAELDSWRQRRITLHAAKEKFLVYKWDLEKLPHE